VGCPCSPYPTLAGSHYTCTEGPKYTGIVYGPCCNSGFDLSGPVFGALMLCLYPFIAALNLICWLFYTLKRAFIDFFG
jgi:hypothetical protein